MAHFATVVTFGNVTVIWETSIRQSFNVVFGRWGPSILEICTLWLFVEVKANYILAAELPLEVNQD